MIAVIGDPMGAIVAASRLRRLGLPVMTQYSGSERKQFRRAAAVATRIWPVEKANEYEPLVLVEGSDDRPYRPCPEIMTMFGSDGDDSCVATEDNQEIARMFGSSRMGAADPDGRIAAAA